MKLRAYCNIRTLGLASGIAYYPSEPWVSPPGLATNWCSAREVIFLSVIPPQDWGWGYG